MELLPLARLAQLHQLAAVTVVTVDRAHQVMARLAQLLVGQVVVMPDFPRSAAGKTLKRELRDPYWAGQGRRI